MNKRLKIERNATPYDLGETFNGKTLSEIASAIAAEEAQQTFGFAEARAFGAGDDCDGLIAASAERRMDKILSDAGLTRERYLELMAARTSDKWVYFGLGGAVGRILQQRYPDL